MQLKKFGKQNHWETFNKHSINIHFCLFLAGSVVTVSSFKALALYIVPSLCLHCFSSLCFACLWATLYFLMLIQGPFKFPQSPFWCFPFLVLALNSWPSQLLFPAVAPTLNCRIAGAVSKLNCFVLFCFFPCHLWFRYLIHTNIFSANPHFTGNINHSVIQIFSLHCSGGIVWGINI